MENITIIAALSKNNVIGFNGKIPWKIKDDMIHFKDLTMGILL
jgi:dihydrofolate reductase